MSVNKFPKEVIDELKHYIYLYIDPDTNEIFYVGKGKGNRVISHLRNASDIEITRKIDKIRSRGKEPKIEILVHGIEDDNTAKKVESALIDLIGIDNLVNKRRGWESIEYGRMDIQEIVASYTHEEVDISEKVILIRINKLYYYGISESELYDATRGIWKISLKRVKKVDYAMAVYGGLIREVYKIEAWFPAGTTLTTREKNG